MNDWQTGSSNVVLKTLIRYVVGFEPMLDGLWIQPAAWMPFESLQFTTHVRNCPLTIDYQNQGSTQRRFTINGQPQEVTFDATMNIDKLWIPYNQLDKRGLEIKVEQ